MGAWNSFQWPLIVIKSHDVQPVEVAVSRLMMAHFVDWRKLSVADIMTTLPLVLLFLGCQRHIIRGISQGEGLQA
ncbi:MAG: hypothetical protein C7B46_13285 [Sulfobacillus benefaciens]|uniref:ABC transmembrane type-1 domain-containing protein n=1 Tax=Sulfobacillus benefaciens TaxID=453960 RepID=A0A2T2XE05_9FIRM|nr:MAG: hypothetical protein C7B46_13285 [Sulfobacillus benefaciens]